MPDVHDHHCETADVGSVCDCECAGAKHAVLNTKGGVPGAGSVTRRAQKIAARDKRPAVVNGLAERVDGPPGRHERGTRRKPAGETVRSNQKPARVSPATAAAIVNARKQLPASSDAWKAAARTADANVLQLLAGSRTIGEANVAKHLDDIAALYEKHAQLEAKKIAASKDGKRGLHGNKEQILATARVVAPHRAWDDPEYTALTTRLSDARSSLTKLDFAEQQARIGQLPVDTRSGLPMPTAALDEHLNTVVSTGRAFLADAKREIDRTGGPQIADARAAIDHEHTIAATTKQVWDLWANEQKLNVDGGTRFPATVTMPDGTTRHLADGSEAYALGKKMNIVLVNHKHDHAEPARRLIRAHERDTIMSMMAEHRPFGGVTHTGATAAPDPVVVRKQYGEVPTRKDWRDRLTRAEQFFPADWLRASADRPLAVGSSDRAFYSPTNNVLSMSRTARDKDAYDGAFADNTDEVNVHELGHRMETLVPGLTALEFAMVRRHARHRDGTVEPIELLPGYNPNAQHPETGQRDDWAEAYTGKTYEQHGTDPDLAAWEVFQVGLQDTFGRGGRRYGSKSDPDELQAFVIGALLTL